MPETSGLSELKTTLYERILLDLIDMYNDYVKKIPVEARDIEYYIKLYNETKKYVKPFSNMIGAAEILGKEIYSLPGNIKPVIVSNTLSIIHSAVKPNILVKLALTGNHTYHEYLVTLIIDKLREANAIKSEEDEKEVRNILKPLYNSVDEAISKIDESIRKYKEAGGLSA